MVAKRELSQTMRLRLTLLSGKTYQSCRSRNELRPVRNSSDLFNPSGGIGRNQIVDGSFQSRDSLDRGAITNRASFVINAAATG